MSRYQIWNKTDNIITPIGEVFSPQEWISKYPMANIPGIKLVIGGGVTNGSVCMEYTSMVESYGKYGVDFSSCVTDQDYLDAIEAFEDMPPASDTVSTEERIAAALEAQVMMSLPDEEVV